ncbi:MAG: glycosyltransferase [Planctomycetes bacterium]|nr:glycosyltransferase [Planctomycetota bacterium]
MNGYDIPSAPAFISLTAVTWDFPLIGRTRMLTESWHRENTAALFIEPPHSYRSFIQSLLRRARPPIHVVRPHPTRYPVRWWPRMHERRLNKMLRDAGYGLRRRLEKKCNLAESAAIVVSPMWTPWLDALPFRRVIYDCIDDLSVHAPDSQFLRLFKIWERELIDRCDGAVVTAEVLRQQIAAQKPGMPIETIRNGVDVDRFTGVAAKLPRPADMPPPSKTPIVGFVGALYEWIDWPLIREVARRLAEFHFVFVGPDNQPAEIAKLAEVSNVTFLGGKPYEVVPAYVAAFDLCWVPFKVGDIASAANPVKIYEYLALGKPVVTTPVADTEVFGPMIRVGRSPDEIAQALRELHESNTPPDIAARQNFACQNSWQQRARDFAAFITGP